MQWLKYYNVVSCNKVLINHNEIRTNLYTLTLKFFHVILQIIKDYKNTFKGVNLIILTVIMKMIKTMKRIGHNWLPNMAEIYMEEIYLAEIYIS